MSLTVGKKLMVAFFFAFVIPISIGSTIVIKKVNEHVSYTKLNDLMNIIDAKYIHLLDFIKNQEAFISSLSADEFIHENLRNYYKNEGSNAKPIQLAGINKYLNNLQNSSKLDEHIMKKEKEKGTILGKVFGRDVKWDMYRLNERVFRYDEIFLLNTNGVVIGSSNSNNIGFNMSDKELFQKGKNKVFVQDVYEDKDGKAVLLFSTPILDNSHLFNGHVKIENNFLGVLAIKISTKFLTDLVTGDLGNQIGGKLFFAGYTPSTDFYILNKEGKMITQSKVLIGKKDTVLKQDSKTLPWQRCTDETLQVREAQEFYMNYAGIEVGGASMCVFDMKWTMVAEQNKDEILALSATLQMIIIAMSILVIIIAYILLHFMGRKIILDPINRLINANAKIKEGNFKAKVELRANDEIGKLGNSFNEMAADLEEKRQQLIHADRLSSLGTMSAGVAHEINNPVSFISNNIQTFEGLWKKSIKSSLEEANKKNKNKDLTFALDQMPIMAKEMREGVKRITNIVNNLNSFARKTAGVFESANILDIIKRAVEFSRLDVEAKHRIKIRLDLAEDIPNIILNIQEMEQVLVNLLVNANHAMEDVTGGRELLLRIKALHINESVVIEIADNGCGIGKKTLSHIFDPFYTTKKTGKGTGLGLSICHGIINEHRGDITATSNLGKGTTVTITLPLDPQKKERRVRDEKTVAGMRENDYKESI